MSALLELLERKSLCYKSFYGLCEEFLEKISKGEIETIEEFQRRRQSLIHVLEELEATAVKTAATTPTVSAETAAAIATARRQADSLIKAIIDLDSKIMRHINRLKDETIQKLQSVQSSRKAISAYRVPASSSEDPSDRGDNIA